MAGLGALYDHAWSIDSASRSRPCVRASCAIIRGSLLAKGKGRPSDGDRRDGRGSGATAACGAPGHSLERRGVGRRDRDAFRYRKAHHRGKARSPGLAARLAGTISRGAPPHPVTTAAGAWRPGRTRQRGLIHLFRSAGVDTSRGAAERSRKPLRIASRQVVDFPKACAVGFTVQKTTVFGTRTPCRPRPTRAPP
jgi:hypothetical protein